MKYIYYYDAEEGSYIIKKYDAEKNGLRCFKDHVLLYHSTMVLNADQIVNTLYEAVKGCNGNERFASPAYFEGLNINYMENDIFVKFDGISYFRDIVTNKSKKSIIMQYDAGEDIKLIDYFY